MTTANPLAVPSALQDVVDPRFHQNNFSAERHIKTELGLKLDKGVQVHTFLDYILNYTR